MKRLLHLVAAVLAVVVSATPPAAATRPDGVWPLRPRPEVVHAFDPPEVRWAAGHRGVDLAGSVGQSVRAALSGRVTFAGRIAGIGVVVVDHGATRTTYQPVAASVPVGADVAAGTPLGTLQWFGTHCLPTACLHWGLLEGDRYLDPLTLVGGPQPVRLLPLDTPATPGRLDTPAAPDPLAAPRLAPAALRPAVLPPPLLPSLLGLWWWRGLR